MLLEKSNDNFPEKIRIGKTKNKPWSNKTEIKLKRKIKKEKRVIIEKKRKNDPIDQKDYDELQKDFKLLKNFKNKKVTPFFSNTHFNTNLTKFLFIQITEKEFENSLINDIDK